MGQADLAPMGDAAAALIERVGLRLEAGEGMAMVDNNSFSTSIAAFAVADCTRLSDALDVAGTLEMEAFVANPSVLHAVLRERPYVGLQTTAGRLRELLPAAGFGSRACHATCRIRSHSAVCRSSTARSVTC